MVLVEGDVDAEEGDGPETDENVGRVDRQSGLIPAFERWPLLTSLGSPVGEGGGELEDAGQGEAALLADAADDEEALQAQHHVGQEPGLHTARPGGGQHSAEERGLGPSVGEEGVEEAGRPEDNDPRGAEGPQGAQELEEAGGPVGVEDSEDAPHLDPHGARDAAGHRHRQPRLQPRHPRQVAHHPAPAPRLIPPHYDGSKCRFTVLARRAKMTVRNYFNHLLL